MAPVTRIGVLTGGGDAPGYVVTTESGRIRAGVFALGEVAGTPLEADAIAKEAQAIAETWLS